MRAIFSSVAHFFVCFLICSPVFAQSSPPTFLFLLEGKGVPTGTVHVFSVNSSSGGITEAPGSPFNAGLLPNQLVVDPTGRFVFVTNEESKDISAFSVDPLAGTLSVLPGSPFFIGAQPVTEAVDPTGRFLYVFAIKNVNGAPFELLYEYTIDPAAGVLTLTSSSPTIWERTQGILISSITFNSAGNFAYLGQVAGGTFGAPTMICSVDFATGALTLKSTVQPANHGAANQIAVSPGGPFLFSINSTGNVADAFTIGSAGSQLTENSAAPYSVPNAPASLFVHPSGNFLYVVNENQSYQTTEQPSQYAGTVSAFAINSSAGTLTPVAGSPVAAGINPASIVVEPTGNFAYTSSTKYTVGYTSFPQILGYSINQSSGTLTPFSSPAFTDAANGNGAQLAVANASVSANPLPTISFLNPPSSAATGTGLTLQVNGANFVPGAAVYFGGQVRTTSYVSSTQLNAGILAADVSTGGSISVFVFDPLPGGGASAPVVFPVTALVPVLTSTLPATIVAGTNAFGFFCTGSNFTTNSIVNFNGNPILTLYFGPTSIFGIALAGDIATAGTATVTVTTSSSGVPGGGTSNAVTVSVTPAVIPISVSNITPSSALAGGPGFILTVLGSGFVQGSQITFNLQSVSTTFMNSTELMGTVPGSAIALAGNPYVIVTNPTGSASTAMTFAINNPPPATGSITPQNLPAGSSALTLNISGTSFAPNSVVLVNGGMRPTTYRNSSQVQATLLPGDLLQSATLNVTVSNPPPGGGTAAALALTVYDYNLSAASPNQSLTAGSQAKFNLTLSAMNGTFGQPVTLAASGLPQGVSASFTPATVPAGSGTTNVVFSVGATVRAAGFRPRAIYPGRTLGRISLLAVLLLGLVYVWCSMKGSRLRMMGPALFLVLLVSIALGLTACSGVTDQPPVQPDSYLGPPLGAYPIVIVGTSGRITMSTQVTLTIM